MPDLPKVPTILEMWDDYVKLCYPNGLDPQSAQHRECRRAFVGGMASTFNFFTATITQFPDEVGMRLITSLREAMRVFSKLERLSDIERRNRESHDRT